MTFTTMKVTAMAVLIVICGMAGSRALGHQQSSYQKQPLRVVKFDGDMASLLRHLAADWGVTIGLETDGKQPRSQVHLFVQEATLADVLNAIVKSEPRYEWRDRDGCIEVLPVGSGSPILDTMVHNFRATDVDQTEAVNRLMSLPELRDIGMGRRAPGNASTQTKNEKFSIKLDGVTMRQALCGIAGESGSRFWIFQTLDNGLFSISNSP
jgi:hypothetical protein